MSEIRNRSIKSTYWIYGGFLIGAVNLYLFTHNNWFTTDEYGLTNTLRDISLLFAAFSLLGTPNFLLKFFPYYKDNVADNSNDILGFALKIALVGFLVTVLLAYLGKPIIIQKFGGKSPMLVEYFFFTLIMAFGIMLFNLLEFYAYGYGLGVTNNILKEVGLRAFTLIVIVLRLTQTISFTTFIFLFCLQYAFIFLILGYILYSRGILHVHFKRSRVTDKFRKKIRALIGLSALVVIIGVLRTSFDSIVLSSRIGLDKSGIFGFSVYLISLMQAPYRSVVSITSPILSRLWKDKKLASIQEIYSRSSIILLTFALFSFSCIWLNFNTGIEVFNINPAYSEGKWVVFIMGIAAILELGTGVNAQIIGTSTYWKFELWTSLLLSALLIPLSYFFTVKFGLTGPAMASLISFFVYNAIRYFFLYNKFGLQPFSKKTIEIILFAFLAYYATRYLVLNITGFPKIIISCGSLLLFYLLFVLLRNISSDAKAMFTGTIDKIKKFRRP